MEFIRIYWKEMIVAIGVMIVVFASTQYFSRTQSITMMPQRQAEQAETVQRAADKAQVQMARSQLEAAAKQIAELKNRPPDTVVHTVIKEVPLVTEREMHIAGADFAIVTNPEQPENTVQLDDHKDTDSVVLNQYNVHAYKKILRQIDYTPQSLDNLSPRELGFAVSRKISKDGKYIGIAVDYNFDSGKASAKFRFTY